MSTSPTTRTLAGQSEIPDSFTSLMTNDGIELREGYAEVGDDTTLALRRGRRRAAGRSCCTASRSSGSAGDGRSPRSRLRAFESSHRTRAATTCRRGRQEFEDYAVDRLADDIRGLIGKLGAESAQLVGHDWGGTIAWTTAMNHPDVVDRLAILNAAHPRRLQQGLMNPNQLRKSWYFFFFALPGLPEDVVHARDWHFFRHFLQDANPPYTPQELERYVEAWSQPGAATGMINYYRASVRASQKQAKAGHPPDFGPHSGHLGPARRLPRLGSRGARA